MEKRHFVIIGVTDENEETEEVSEENDTINE